MRKNMRKNIKPLMTTILMMLLLVALTACSQKSDELTTNQNHQTEANESTNSETALQTPEANESEDSTSDVTELYVRFGDDGAAFPLHLYDNETAAAIAYHVGTSDWRLPIYHYDDYDNWEVMQYYDIPSRYEIPDNAESISSEKAGTVYYSEPNRIVLFYQDAEVSGDYTPVGYFDYSEDFLNAVEENPVLEGWGNKIVHISDRE